MPKPLLSSSSVIPVLGFEPLEEITSCRFPNQCLSRLFDHHPEDCMHPNELTYHDHTSNSDC